MTDKIIVPTADAVITPVLEKMYALRPTCFRHLNLRSGVYWHPVLGYRSQAAKTLARLAAMTTARRLKTATGQDLLDYVASEYDAVPSTEKTFATGQIRVGRANPPPALAPAGTIPKGTKFTRAAVTVLGVEIKAAEFETLVDAFIPADYYIPVTIPVRATREGAHANTPILLTQAASTITFPNLFPNIGIFGFESGGGSEGADDEYVRAYARAFAVGQYGPTSAASRLGALKSTGVRHLLVFDHVPSGTQRVLVADSSWGSSDALASLTQQTMYDADLVGFGCKVLFGKIRSRVISVSATVSLRDANYLVNTTDIDDTIRKAVRSYFDDRADWNVWNTQALTAVIARSHPKIFSCSGVIVRDVNDGLTVPEIVTPDYNAEQTHNYLANNAMSLTYVGPS